MNAFSLRDSDIAQCRMTRTPFLSASTHNVPRVASEEEKQKLHHVKSLSEVRAVEKSAIVWIFRLAGLQIRHT
jgi:hypothetical protein